ncbi:hypothetical protein GCM10007416_30750 [Kroppenstedtia guangzhouensis]|uniref:Uncharacterized protein n=1 Tax=Kroppenstedtia guangzhouensis TaxID=1274356 RepID=A0ABQ1H195_9BACL|nr:hypothetical protein GCM10007416_30750 [Kroppenstedtia guangzhouensis]
MGGEPEWIWNQYTKGMPGAVAVPFIGGGPGLCWEKGTLLLH